MKMLSCQKSDPIFLRLQKQRLSGAGGNVLIFVVVLMLIFGALGVAMVSMFSSSTASTVTRNDTRRALFLSESGVRYATSEMRKADFDEDSITDPLNTLTYTVSGAGTFDPNIFTPWFDSDASVDSPDIISVSPRLGELPDDFTATALTDVWAVNYEYITGTAPDITTMRDEVDSYTVNGTSLDVDITSDFVVNEGERVCLAVEPTEDRTITEGGDLYVARDARHFFPKFNGAININRVDYAYERLVDDEAGDQVILKKVTASQFPVPPAPLTAFPLTVDADPIGSYTGDFVILSPRNHMAMAEGTSDAVTWGDAYTQGANVYDDSLIRPGSRKPDITAEDFVTDLSEQETDSRFFERNLTDYELDIGGGGADEFGSAFYDATRDIGGQRDYCNAGACLFEQGVRVFFLVDFDGQGDGITFTLLGEGFPAPNNSALSVGGDVQLSELMGYAGDSRQVVNADPADDADFLAATAADRGLDPPKIAVEFDTRTNEPIFNFCSGANANPETRNDPVPGGVDDKDVVQYVFWGREVLDLACRSGADNATYDDNRHNADDWIYGTGDEVRSSPAVAADGTIYVGSNDSNLYAINPDGTLKWVFSDPSGAIQSSPAIAADGTIYVGSDDTNFYAINSTGTLKWQAPTGAEVRSSPAIAADGTIYIGSDDGILYAFDPAGPPAIWTRPNPDNSGERFSLGRPAIGPAPDRTIYVSDMVSRLYAVRPTDGVVIGTFNLGDGNDYMPGIDPSSGTVYSDRVSNRLAAIEPDLSGTFWNVNIGADIDSTPVVDSNGNVYFGTDAGELIALDSGGGPIWTFGTGTQVDNIPALFPSPPDDSEVVYVVSRNGNLYAVATADGSELWRFPIPVTNPQDRVPISSPAVGADGTVYVGSTDNNLYAVGRPAEPGNIRDKLITLENLGSEVSALDPINWLNGNDSISGSWAVRLEVDRALVPNVEGKFDYQLRLWIRQCPDQNDDPCTNILGTFFQDTRIAYDYTAVEDLPLRQNFSLDGTQQDNFERFFFGFTGAAGAQALDATISQFQLSFIRPGDPVISCDSINWPAEAPVPDCVPQL